jgi:hypothetical protein
MAKTPSKLRLRRRLDALILQIRSEQHGQMARNFAKSMLMLGAAMVAALYANSSARQGRVFSAGTAALIAMGIAIWVGVRFVPRLAAGVDWNWLPFFTHYKVTRDGWIFITASVVVVSAAINTNNNLLYMVLSAMLAVLILSGLLSGLNLKFLKTHVRLPDHCYANQPFQMAITLDNPKRVFPTFSMEVTPADDSPFDFASYYVALVGADTQQTRTVTATIPTRGSYDLEDLRLQSRYPFGFLVKGRDFPAGGRIVAFPEILPEENSEVAVRDILGTSERFERGHGMDLYMIREYLPSDTARHVDWKASAKTAQLKTREFAAEESRRIVLVFDRYGRDEDVDAFEHLVSETASMAVYLVRDGAEVSLISDDWTSPAGRTETEIDPILYYLALVTMSSSAPEPFTSGGEESLPFSLRSRTPILRST